MLIIFLELQKAIFNWQPLVEVVVLYLPWHHVFILHIPSDSLENFQINSIKVEVWLTNHKAYIGHTSSNLSILCVYFWEFKSLGLIDCNFHGHGENDELSLSCMRL